MAMLARLPQPTMPGTSPNAMFSLLAPHTAIPAHVSRLSEGALVEGTQHPGVFGKGSFGGRGYRGPTPVPDHGLHTYVFQLFALAAPLPGDRASLSRAQLAKAMSGLVLARGRLDGTYER